MKLFWIFIILNIANVVIQTAKSILTIKGNKWVASIANAVAFGLYTVVIVYMVCDLPLWLKVIVVSTANLVGVFIVKLIEEKSRKDKLWKIELTVPTKYAEAVDFDTKKVPHSKIKLDEKYTLFNFYCETQKESAIVKGIVEQYEAKYFVAESRTL